MVLATGFSRIFFSSFAIITNNPYGLVPDFRRGCDALRLAAGRAATGAGGGWEHRVPGFHEHRAGDPRVLGHAADADYRESVLSVHRRGHGLRLDLEVLRAAELSDALRESEARMAVAAEAANFGIWIRDHKTEQIWATAKGRELFGFTPTEPLSMQRFIDRLHPEDRDAVRQSILESGNLTSVKRSIACSSRMGACAGFPPTVASSVTPKAGRS